MMTKSRYLLIFVALVLLVGIVGALPLTAEFSGTPLAVCVNEPVYFTDESYGGGGNITAWKWNFGDLGDSSEQNPTHSYSSPGVYNVSLRVDDDLGADDSTIRFSYINVSTCGLGGTVPWCEDIDMFFWYLNDDIPGYRVLNNEPEPDDQHTITSPSVSSTTGEQTLGTWITPITSFSTKTIAPGLWRYRIYAKASSDAGITTMKFRTFNRSSDGTITWLFFGNAFTKDITHGTVPDEYLLSYARRNYTTLFPGDRLGIQVNVSTDSAAARTVSMDIGGNTNASMVGVSYWLCPSAGVYYVPPHPQTPLPPHISIIGIPIAALLFLRRKL